MAKLESAFETLAVVSQDGFTSCPFDNGASLDAIFRYPDGPPVIAVVQLSGCNFVKTGRTGAAYLGKLLEKRLRALTKAR